MLVGSATRLMRVDHVVGGERAAVVEFHARPQRELDRGRIGRLPFGREQRLELEGVGIAIDQRVPGLVLHHHAGAQAVVIGIDVRQRVAHRDPQRVGGLSAPIAGAARKQRPPQESPHRTSIACAYCPPSLQGNPSHARWHSTIAAAVADHGLRRFAAAALDRDAAARMEPAAGRDIGRIGHDVAEADIRHAAAGLRRQHAGEQRLRVGMAGRCGTARRFRCARRCGRDT